MRFLLHHLQGQNCFRYIITFVILVVSSRAASQEISAISLFESDSIVHVRMITDMKLLVKNKYKEIYQPATIQIFQSDGDTNSYEVEIKSRGNRRKDACNLPPIKVKFPKEDFLYNKLKWVITCNNSDPFDQVLLKEYMAYQIYERYSEKGFGTELLHVDYIDTGRDNKTFTRYAFIIESAESVADRIGGRVYEPKALKKSIINEEQLAQFTMFQYMIANTDWAIKNLHNIEAVTDPATSSVLVLPYDFDYAGFVDAHYAIPNESLPIEKVTERYNKGYCMTEEICEKLRIKFISSRDEVLQTCREFKYFNKKTRKSTELYLKEFFDKMENHKVAKSTFCENCKSTD